MKNTTKIPRGHEARKQFYAAREPITGNFDRHTQKMNTPTRVFKFIDGALSDNISHLEELNNARKIQLFGGAEAMLLGARAIIDVVSRHSDTLGNTAAIHLAKAGLLAEQAGSIDPIGGIKLSSEKLKRQLPMRMVLSEGELPSINMIKKAHTAGIDAIPDTFSFWDRTKNKNDSQRRGEAIGYVSEEVVSLLLSRFVCNNSIDRWVPIQSTLSQDMSRMNGVYRTGWDASIYTGISTDGAQNDLTHKIQTKTREPRTRRERQKNLYIESDDFSVVHVSSLTAAADKTASTTPFDILHELWDERNTSNQHATRALDQRTDALLDILG